MTSHPDASCPTSIPAVTWTRSKVSRIESYTGFGNGKDPHRAPGGIRQIRGKPSAGDPVGEKSGRRVRSIFAAIAPRYDLLNPLLSLNIDRLWRRFTTRTVPPEPGVPVLDCCTG